MSAPRHIADIIPIRRSGMPTTDAEWAEHDRRVAEARALDAAREASRMAAERRAAFREAGFPDRALEAAIRADERVDAIRRISSWPTDDQTILVLSGAAGTGKTVAATWWALRRRLAPVFVRATSFAASSRYDRDTRDTWLRAPALVLDDLGTEYADTKGSFLVDLDELIDTFYADRRPLVVTTNCDVHAFKARYGERIADRIRECGEFYGVRGVSLRRNQ